MGSRWTQLNAKEAAALVGRDIKTLRGWINQGLLPATRIGHVWDIKREDLAQIVEVPEVIGPVEHRISQELAALHHRLDDIERMMRALAGELAWLRDHAIVTGKAISLEAFAHDHRIHPLEVLPLEAGEVFVMHDTVVTYLRQRGVAHEPCESC